MSLLQEFRADNICLFNDLSTVREAGLCSANDACYADDSARPHFGVAERRVEASGSVFCDALESHERHCGTLAFIHLHPLLMLRFIFNPFSKSWNLYVKSH